MGGADIFSLPDDILISDIIPHLSLYDLLQLCQTHPRFAKLCRGDLIWRIRSQKEYPEIPKPDKISWRDFYMYLITNTKYVPVIYKNIHIGKDRKSVV